jgi:hypothetical protein
VPISNASIFDAIETLSYQLREGIQQILGAIAMSESQVQTDIDNAVTVLTGLLTDLGGDETTVVNDLTLIKQQIANGQPVDTTKLDAAIATVTGVQTGLDGAITSLTGVANPTTSTTPTTSGPSAPAPTPTQSPNPSPPAS